MRGSLVIARDYKGHALIRRVWESGSKLVWLSEESQFERLSTGMEALRPIGFPIEDVFIYDHDAIKMMTSGSLNWSSLRPVTASLDSQVESVVSSE